jgi:ubiquinone/menaquinone biosynthesis C-methylase UbiE
MEGNLFPAGETAGAENSFLDPNQLIRHLDIKKGDHIGDFGAGHGFFTIPMARAVGGDGKVYAVDIQKSTLDVIRTRARFEHLLHVEPVWGDIEEPRGSKLKDQFLDLVLIANTLFQASKKEEVVREAWRVLRSGGRLAVIEWDQTAALLGPPLAIRVKMEAVRSFAEQSGFSFERQFDAGSHHYGLIFKK